MLLKRIYLLLKKILLALGTRPVKKSTSKNSAKESIHYSLWTLNNFLFFPLGLCQPRVSGVVGAEPFSAKLRYTGPEDPDYANFIKLTVTMPHIDGMI